MSLCNFLPFKVSTTVNLLLCGTMRDTQLFCETRCVGGSLTQIVSYLRSAACKRSAVRDGNKQALSQLLHTPHIYYTRVVVIEGGV